MAAQNPADAWIGRVIAEKYRVTRCLGVGGHGAVFEAENTWTERLVALKILSSAAAMHPELSERFLREARASTRVGHPAIVEVLDMGRDAADGTLFIVQELLLGEDLRDLLKRERAIAPQRAVKILTPVMEALTAAHEVGVVHRDLKPANIFLARRRDGQVTSKLIDFGVSRMSEGPSTHELTLDGALLGTPDYMSPEQARGEKTGPLSDVWSLGIVLYEMLVGRRPYAAQNYHALLVRIVADDVPPITEAAPGISPALAEIVHRALARNAEQRYPSMTAFREALCGWLAEAPPAALEAPIANDSFELPSPDLSDPTPVSLHQPLMDDPAPSLSAPASGPRVLDRGHPSQPSAPSVPSIPPAPPAPPVRQEILVAAPTASSPSRLPARAPRSNGALWLGFFATALAAAAITWRLKGQTNLPHDAAVTPAVTAAIVPPPATDAANGSDALLELVETIDASVALAPDDAARARSLRDVRVLRDAQLDVASLPLPSEIRARCQTMAPAIRGCAGSTSGTMQVTIVVLGSGRVESVTVPAPWAATASGSCVSAVVRRVRFSPFLQDRFSFMWPFVLEAIPVASDRIDAGSAPRALGQRPPRR